MQAFERFRLARPEPAQTGFGALKEAETLRRRVLGAEALRILADDETGRPEGVTILGPSGDVPEDLAERPSGGRSA